MGKNKTFKSQIRKNMKKVKRMGLINPSFKNSEIFCVENFLDENLERYIKYLKKIKAVMCLYEGKVAIVDFTTYVTPEEIEMLGDSNPLDASLVFEDDDYIIEDSEEMALILLTRCADDRERALKLLAKYDRAKYFSSKCLKDEYIDSFEKFLEKVFDRDYNEAAGYCFDLYHIDPEDFDEVVEHMDRYFYYDEEEDFLSLTQKGLDLVSENYNKDDFVSIFDFNQKKD